MEQVDAIPDGQIVSIARGLLLALAIPSIATVVFPGGSGGGALRMLADLATLPAFFAVAGWLMAGSIVATANGPFMRAVTSAALCGGASALVAAATALPTGHDWRYGLAQAAPALALPLLTAAYALAARALRRTPVACFVIAAAAHVVGVILDKPTLVNFIFFAAGLALAARREAFLRIVKEEKEFAVASGPLAATVAAAVAIRFAQTGQAPSIAALGPIAIALGLAAGPATIATATALRMSPLGAAFAALGRAAPALAILWLPLFVALIGFANRGSTPSAASALLMATASLLFIAVVVDICREAVEKTRFARLFAPT